MLKINSQNLISSSSKIRLITNISIFRVILLNFMRFFFTSIYFSKEITIFHGINFGILAIVSLFFSLFLTILYSLRLLRLLFLHKNILIFRSNYIFTQEITIYFCVISSLGFLLFSNSLYFILYNLALKLLLSTYFFLFIFYLKILVNIHFFLIFNKSLSGILFFIEIAIKEISVFNFFSLRFLSLTKRVKSSYLVFRSVILIFY